MTSEEKLTKSITPQVLEDFYNQKVAPFLNGAAHAGFTPIGTVISVMGTTAPMNYLACDGTVYNISDYTELAAYFNQQFGSSNFFGGDGTTTFAVPDLRGEFLRGTGTNSHANCGNGASVGTHQAPTYHHQVLMYYNGTNQLEVGTAAPASSASFADSYGDSIVSTDQYTGGSISATRRTSDPRNKYVTSRPTNTSVLYCIASKNIFMDAGSNYSTEEQVVGTWIGKPLYQKTLISDTTITTGNYFVSEMGALNSDFVQKIYTAIRDTTNNRWLGEFYNGSNDCVQVKLSNTGVWFIINGITCGGARVTIQYTKTTDA